MLKPASNLMIVEEYRESEGIILPENATPGKLFRILEVGDGWINDDGTKTPISFKRGDIAAIGGKILTIPYKKKDYLIARAEDVLAYDRGEEIDIPDKI